MFFLCDGLSNFSTIYGLAWVKYGQVAGSPVPKPAPLPRIPPRPAAMTAHWEFTYTPWGFKEPEHVLRFSFLL
jgi:hypothetical protein